MCDQQSFRSAWAYAQSDQSLCLSLDYSMIVKLLTEHHLEFLSLKGGCTGWSESTLVKMPHCWKSHVTAQLSCSSVISPIVAFIFDSLSHEHMAITFSSGFMKSIIHCDPASLACVCHKCSGSILIARNHYTLQKVISFQLLNTLKIRPYTTRIQLYLYIQGFPFMSR